MKLPVSLLTKTPLVNQVRMPKFVKKWNPFSKGRPTVIGGVGGYGNTNNNIKNSLIGEKENDIMNENESDN